jgi:hypothetical protein
MKKITDYYSRSSPDASDGSCLKAFFYLSSCSITSTTWPTAHSRLWLAACPQALDLLRRLTQPVADDVFTTEAQRTQSTHRDGLTTEMTCLRFAAGSDTVGHLVL